MRSEGQKVPPQPQLRIYTVQTWQTFTNVPNDDLIAPNQDAKRKINKSPLCYSLSHPTFFRVLCDDAIKYFTSNIRPGGEWQNQNRNYMILKVNRKNSFELSFREDG
ncbi:hypothetical protein ACTXT7_004558 [Hymenolepis weldensis]